MGRPPATRLVFLVRIIWITSQQFFPPPPKSRTLRCTRPRRSNTRLGQKSACGPVIIQLRLTGPTLAVTLAGMFASQGSPVLLLYCKPVPPLPSTLTSNFNVKSWASSLRYAM